MWEPSNGKLLHRMVGHTRQVMDDAFDSAGQILASGGFDNTVILWEVAGGGLLRKILVGRTVNGIAFKPGGSNLVIAAC